MEQIRELEHELDNWRTECFENFMYQVYYGTRNGMQESISNYKTAINSHTLEYVKNREELLELTRKTLKW